MIRILLADDQHLVRGALAALLDLEPDFEVVASVADGAAAVAAAVADRPDIALLDIEMPGVDGITATAEIRAAAPAVRVLILTTFGRPRYLRRAMAPGRAGSSSRTPRPSGWPPRSATCTFARTVVDPDLAVASLSSGPSPLTGREREVLRAGSDGAAVAAVAARLMQSEGTVRNYLSSAIGKTGARNRVEATSIARDLGWL